MEPIYLDYNATTPIASEVLEAMLPYLREHFGNPSSSHRYGQVARGAVEEARRQVAELLGSAPSEVVFTSGGTESNNHAIRGVAEAAGRNPCHVITSQIEHPSVLETCRYLESHGAEVTYLPVDQSGMVAPEDVAAAITERTVLVTIMHANNEVGTIQPVAEIGAMARSRGVIFHTDAAQSVGKIPTRVDELNVDLLTVAGHKLYAPKGIGALYLRSGVALSRFVHGAGHEGGRRAGTENVPYMFGLGRACELVCSSDYAGQIARLRALRDRLHTRLQGSVERVHLNGHPEQRLPNTLSLSFEGLDGAELLSRLPGLAASTGSACHEGRAEPSAVLVAMGVSRHRGLGAVRFSLGRYTTEGEVDRAAALVAEAAGRAGSRPVGSGTPLQPHPPRG